MENTITEHDLDATSLRFVQGLAGDDTGVENDLDVDGLSESLLSKIVSLFTSRRH